LKLLDIIRSLLLVSLLHSINVNPVDYTGFPGWRQVCGRSKRSRIFPWKLSGILLQTISHPLTLLSVIIWWHGYSYML